MKKITWLFYSIGISILICCANVSEQKLDKASKMKKEKSEKQIEQKVDLSFLKSYDGKSYDEIIKSDNGYLDGALKELLGEKYKAVLFPIRQSQANFNLADPPVWLDIYGSASYPGGIDESTICIDLNTGNICAGLIENGEKDPQKWCHDIVKIPPPFMRWLEDSN